jgi:hypothetical protein
MRPTLSGTQRLGGGEDIRMGEAPCLCRFTYYLTLLTAGWSYARYEGVPWRRLQTWRHEMKVATALVAFLMPLSAHAQNPFAPRLDQLTPPANQPICSAWYREQALPSYGCRSDSIQKICSGLVPKANSSSDCLALNGTPSNMGNTCQTQMGECQFAGATVAPLGSPCYCNDIAGRP